MYDRAPNRVERLEMIYRYPSLTISDPSENSMIGNSKNTDLAERVSTEPTRREGSKTFSDSSRILPVTFTGRLSETSPPCPRPWLWVSLLCGFSPFGKWKLTHWPLTRSTSNCCSTERTLRAAREEWRDSTREPEWLLQTSGTLSSEAHWCPTRLKSTQPGDKTSERNSNSLTPTMLNFEMKCFGYPFKSFMQPLNHSLPMNLLLISWIVWGL